MPVIEWALNAMLGCFAVAQYTAHRAALNGMALKVKAELIRYNSSKVIEMLVGVLLGLSFHRLNGSQYEWHTVLVIWMVWISVVQIMFYSNYTKERREDEKDNQG